MRAGEFLKASQKAQFGSRPALPVFFAIVFLGLGLGRPVLADRYWGLDAGVYIDNITQRLSAPAGYASQVSSISGFLRARRGFGLGGRFTFEPAIGARFPWISSADGTALTFTFQFDLDLKYDLFPFLSVRAGPGVLYLLTASSASTVNLSNGTGTSAFYMPGGVEGVFLLTAASGLEVKLFRGISLNLDVWIPDIGSGSRRRLEGAISLGLRL
jgi:hypothetical protein